MRHLNHIVQHGEYRSGRGCDGAAPRMRCACVNGKKKKKKKIGHHARPRRPSATAPLRTGADTCIAGSGARKRAGTKSDPVRRRSNHAWTEDQAGKRKCANTDAVGGWRVHTADDTPSRNAATRSKHYNFMYQGDIQPRAAAGSSRNATTQAVAATTGIQLVGNTASNTASAWSQPEHTRKRSSRRRASATEVSMPGIHWQSNSRCYTEKATNAWSRQGTQHTNSIQTRRPSFGATHRKNSGFRFTDQALGCGL